MVVCIKTYKDNHFLSYSRFIQQSEPGTNKTILTANTWQ